MIIDFPKRLYGDDEGKNMKEFFYVFVFLAFDWHPEGQSAHAAADLSIQEYRKPLENSLDKLTDFFRKDARIYRLSNKAAVSYGFDLFSAFCHYRSSHKNDGNITRLFVLS